MLKLTLEQKKKGIKEEFTYVNSNGRMSKQYTYKGMFITWDNQILHGKWYYWRASYYLLTGNAYINIIGETQPIGQYNSKHQVSHHVRHWQETSRVGQ